MTRIEWRDLSDSELRAKLENRGVHPGTAAIMVKHRETPSGQDAIELWLRP